MARHFPPLPNQDPGQRNSGNPPKPVNVCSQLLGLSDKGLTIQSKVDPDSCIFTPTGFTDPVQFKLAPAQKTVAINVWSHYAGWLYVMTCAPEEAFDAAIAVLNQVCDSFATTEPQEARK